MIITNRKWQQVRKWFDADEMLAIHKAQTAESTSLQQGFIVDEDQLSAELRSKVKFHMMEDRAENVRRAGGGGV